MIKSVLFCAIFIIAFANVEIDWLIQRDLGLNGGKADILVMMSNDGHLDTLAGPEGQSLDSLSWIELGRYVVGHKMKIANQEQKSLLSSLREKRIRHTSFWVANCIAIYGASEELIKEISQRTDVRMLISNREFNVPLLPEEQPDLNAKMINETAMIEWNVKWIKADKVWDEFRARGEGIVTANADTGIMYEHKALVSNYRGNKGSGKFDHNYNWFDGLREGSCGRCPCSGKVPCDDQTHCIGTTAGGVDRKIGVAPGSKWIGCRAFSDMARRASPASFLHCLQFFAAPSDLEGKNPNPDLRPHVSSHSYGCPTFYCPNSEFLKEAADTLKKVGHFMVVSAGNSGPSCSSVNRPPGHMGNIFSVGASNTNSNTIASFSSRGPITLDRSNRRKPDITAPGVGVWSSVANGGYASYSGTSMASPAVNGAIALIWSAVPRLNRKVEETQKIIEETAHKMPVTNQCQSNGSPNNVYGHGIIDVYAAVKRAKELYGN